MACARIALTARAVRFPNAAVFLLLLTHQFLLADPAYPTSFVNTDTIPTVTGSTFTVNAGGSIQTAINNAAAANDSLTHEIVIQAGATFNENLTLPNKGTGTTGWIIVRTSNLAGIAAQKKRIIQATHASAMPKIQMTAQVGMDSNANTNHFRFIGIEFIQVGGTAGLTGIRIWGGSGSHTLAQTPNDVIFDRCIVRNTGIVRKLVAIETGAGVAVIDSVVKLSPNEDGDSNALWIFDGLGPTKIVNNELQGNGETVFFGAAGYSNTIPQNIEFRRNLIHPAANTGAAGKNVIEWKQGLRCWLAGNIFENSNVAWVNGQRTDCVMSPQDEGLFGSLAVVNDIIWEYNFFRNVRAAFSMGGQGFGQTGQHLQRVAVRHNFLDGVRVTGPSTGDVLSTSNQTDQVTLDHNTSRNVDGAAATNFGTSGETLWIFRNNITEGDIESLNGPFTQGTAALNRDYTNPRVFSRNVLAGASATYTGTDLSDNFFPASVSLNADGSLPVGSPYINQATDGTNIGADFTTLYGIPNGIGRFNTGANDFYAYTGQWPTAGGDPTPLVGNVLLGGAGSILGLGILTRTP